MLALAIAELQRCGVPDRHERSIDQLLPKRNDSLSPNFDLLSFGSTLKSASGHARTSESMGRCLVSCQAVSSSALEPRSLRF